MAQVKLLKIAADGFQEENGSADDITFATVTGSTSVGVTNGVTITSDIAFNAVTDSIAGIENQNLLDKTADESISGDWTVTTGHNLTLVDAPVNSTDAVNKDYADSLSNGADWQDSVLDKDLSTPPASPTSGDRYIIGPSATGAWAGHENDIAEYNGSAWVFIVPNKGFAATVEDENTVYNYNGTAWVKMSTVYNHNDLAGLNVGDYKHLTAAEDSWVDSAIVTVPTATNLIDKSAATTISGDMTFTGTSNMNGGDLILPGSAMGTPTEGSMYWDGTSDTLYAYNGSAYVNVSSAGTASGVVNQYIAGTGGIAQYDAVYISGADTVLKADATATSTAKVIGFAPNAIAATSNGDIQEDGIISGILSGATAGDVYFLSETAGQIATTRPTASGSMVVKVGYAKNATDLQVQFQFMGRRS